MEVSLTTNFGIQQATEKRVKEYSSKPVSALLFHLQLEDSQTNPLNNKIPQAHKVVTQTYAECRKIQSTLLKFLESLPPPVKKSIFLPPLQTPNVLLANKIKSQIGDKFIGIVINEFPNGYGKLTLKDRIYIGEMRNGLPHGYGKETIGRVEYQGMWKNGLRHGVGIEYTPKSELKGFWSENKKSTMIIYPTGNVYIGECENHTRHGKGTLWLALGRSYKCFWINDNPKNIVKIEYESGNVYKSYHGQLKDNAFHGYGTLIFRNGNSYTGN